MAIDVRINGNPGKEGFLIAPEESKQFPMPVALKTTDGSTVKATLNVVASGVQVALSKTDVTIGPKQTTVKIVAKSASVKAGDITLQVKVGGRVSASVTLTSIQNPQIRFTGRFQARFATDGDFFNEPRGTDAGWNFALEGEPDFVPSTNNVPTQPGMAVGRVVRFQDAVALRTHVAPVGVTVTSIEGELQGGKLISFAAGDPIIGEKVSLGPNSYLAANEPQNPADPPPFETYDPGFEPIENFELHIGKRFSGKPASLENRPKANGLFRLTPAELKQYGIITLDKFNKQRKAELLADYHKLSPADRTGTEAGRNLATRISHLGGSAPDNIAPSQGTLPVGWGGKEVYNGLVNDGVQVTPGNSVLLAYFKLFQEFRYSGTFFNYHSDEQCGRVDGTLTPFTAELKRLIV